MVDDVIEEVDPPGGKPLLGSSSSSSGGLSTHAKIALGVGAGAVAVGALSLVFIKKSKKGRR